jgi:hypothetical protein
LFAKKNCYLFCTTVTHVACSQAFFALPFVFSFVQSLLGAAIKGATSFSSQENPKNMQELLLPFPSNWFFVQFFSHATKAGHNKMRIYHRPLAASYHPLWSKSRGARYIPQQDPAQAIA